LSEFNVLVTSAGRRVSLLRTFQEELLDLGLKGKVIAADASEWSSAFHDSGEGVVVPPCRDDNYVPELLRLCRRKSISLLIPTIDTELSVLAAHRDDFAAINTWVNVSSEEVVSIGVDKFKTRRWLADSGLPTVEHYEPDQISAGNALFPVIAKPRFGSSSMGLRWLHSPSDISGLNSETEYVYQSKARGLEYTIDILCDSDGSLLSAVPRRRVETRAGEMSKGCTVRSETLLDLAKSATGTLKGIRGVINLQCFWEGGNTVPQIIEINPRFGGGFPLSNAAGARFPRWLIEHVAGFQSTASDDWEDNMVMLRYDDAIYVPGNVITVATA